jgi:hypothetical protein
MKKLILLSVIMLTGCATVNEAVDAFLMKYDNNEYKIITEIRTKASYGKDNCSYVEDSKKLAKELEYKSLFLKNYAEKLPHNKPVQESSVELHNMVKGLSDMYDKGSVSPVFCKIKFTSIEESATRIQQSEGNKPR